MTKEEILHKQFPQIKAQVKNNPDYILDQRSLRAMQEYADQESLIKDTRIKELEAEVKEMEKHVLSVHDKASDITVKCITDVKKEMMAFTEWAADCDYNHHDQDNYWQKFDWDCGSGTGPKLTTAELLAEYKKQLTK